MFKQLDYCNILIQDFQIVAFNLIVDWHHLIYKIPKYQMLFVLID